MKKFKTSPFLVLKSHKNYGLILENYFLKKSYSINFKYLSILIYGVGGRSYKDLIKASQKLGLNEDVVKSFISQDLLVSESSSFFKKYQWEVKRWHEYNHDDSLYYHISCLNYPFINYSDHLASVIDRDLMSLYAIKSKRPPLYKGYPLRFFLALKKPKEFPRIDSKKVFTSARSLGVKKFSLELLSLFLYASFGKTKEVRNLPLWQFYRTAPSGGGKNPTEVYILLFTALKNFLPGIYHYNVKNHGLDCVKIGDFRKEFFGACGETFEQNHGKQKIIFGVLYTSMLERAMWRYRDIRSSRAIFADVGHLIQNARYAGVALGLSALSEYNFNEVSLKRLIKSSPKEVLLHAQAFYN